MKGNVSKIVVHKGQAHADELMACALYYGVTGNTVPIYRRDPTEEELGDPTVLVMDVGLRHEPDLLNFDHHQLQPEDELPDCAATLVAKELGLHDTLKLQPWYRNMATLDALGPFKLAKRMGLKDFPFGLLSPLEMGIKKAFEEAEDEHEVASWIVTALKVIGTAMIKDAVRYAINYERLLDVDVVRLHGPDGTAVDVIINEDSDTTGIQAARDARNKNDPADIAASISFDDRGEGWALYRFNDDPRVDFTRLCGRDEILFCHNGGFIAKTKERREREEVLALVAEALVKEAT